MARARHPDSHTPRLSEREWALLKRISHGPVLKTSASPRLLKSLTSYRTDGTKPLVEERSCHVGARVAETRLVLTDAGRLALHLLMTSRIE